MSNGQSNAAIQDVLSSIRRLVSEDLRTEPRRIHDGPSSAGETKASGGKLVLTEALRVPETPPSEAATPSATATEDAYGDSDDESALGEAAETLDAQQRLADAWDADAVNDDFDSTGAREGPSSDAAASLEDTIAELEAAVAGIGEVFEPDGSEEPLQPHLSEDDDDTVLEFSFPVDEADDGSGSEVGAGADHVTAARADEAPLTHAAVAGGAVAKKGMAIRLGFEDDPDNGQTKRASEEMVRAGAADAPEGPDSDLQGDDSSQPTDASGSAPDDAPVHFDHPADALATVGAASGRIRRLNLAGSSGENERSMQANINSGDWVGAGSINTADSADNQSAGDDGDDLLFGAVSEDGIDREALRELVAEIIRQELQGPLGERITRNVRKLVRREINRALDMGEAD